MIRSRVFAPGVWIGGWMLRSFGSKGVAGVSFDDQPGCDDLVTQGAGKDHDRGERQEYDRTWDRQFHGVSQEAAGWAVIRANNIASPIGPPVAKLRPALLSTGAPNRWVVA